MLSLFGEKFAIKCVQRYYEKAVTPMITNNWYEGQVTERADRLNILTIGLETSGGVAVTALQNWTPGGSALTLHEIGDSEAQLVPNQRKAYYFQIDSVAKYETYVDDPKENILDQQYGLLYETIDAYVLGLHSDVAAGNRVGTDQTTGTVEVIVTSGQVDGSGTTFLATDVGKGFKALGHTAWYRVKSFASTISIIIEDDLDDVATAYTGGAIGAGATFVIEASTVATAAKADIYAKILSLKQKLDEAKMPQENRWIVFNSALANIVLQAPEFIPAVPAAYEDAIKNGRIGQISGFSVYQNEQIAGTAAGYYILAGHISWMTFAQAFVESTIEEDLPGQFGKAYKGLNCYGGKVIDIRRKAGASGFWKV